MKCSDASLRAQTIDFTNFPLKFVELSAAQRQHQVVVNSVLQDKMSRMQPTNWFSVIQQQQQLMMIMMIIMMVMIKTTMTMMMIIGYSKYFSLQ